MEKKKIIIISGIIVTLIILMGSAYAFFTYSKSREAFTLTSNNITATFVGGSNQINFTNAYPISDEYAISNIDKLTYIDFTVSGDAENPKEAVTYEIYLTEKDGNTMDSKYIKVYLTDNFNNEVVSPILYSSLDNTTYQNDSATGKVILKNTLAGEFDRHYRLYAWIDSTFSENIELTFDFYVNIYAYNDMKENANVTVTFDANGGTVSGVSKDVTVGGTYGTLPTPTRDGYGFAGWSELIDNDYLELEYISSTGTQYIDTGIVPSENFEYYIKYRDDAASGSNYVMASRANNSAAIYQAAAGAVASQNVSIARHTTTTPNNYREIGLIYEMSATYNSLGTGVSSIKCLDKGDEFTGTQSDSSAGATANLIVFGYRSVQRHSGMSLYKLKLYNDGELTRDFVPVQKLSTGKIGLYDKVTKEFYRNLGTGEFLAGPLKEEVTSASIVSTSTNHTLYANWVKNPVVTFDPNGGTVETLSKSVVYHESYGELPIPTRSGYEFLGWNGKNLFDYQNILDNNSSVSLEELNGTSTISWINNDSTSNQKFLEGYFKENTRYTFSGKIANSKISSNRFLIIYNNTDSYQTKYTDFLEANTFYNISTVSRSNSSISFFKGSNTGGGKLYIDINSFQIEEGTIVTEYEPYYVTSSTKVVQNKDHTLKAIWKEN